MDLKKFSSIHDDQQTAVERRTAALSVAQNFADSPTMRAINELQKSGVMGRAAIELERHSKLLRAALGPLAEIRHLGLSGRASELFPSIQLASKVLENYSARFTLPRSIVAAGLVEQFRSDPLREALARYAAQTEGLQQSLSAMTTPWLDAQNAQRSLIAFAEIQGMGGMLDRMPSFDAAVSNALRTDLGDWRDEFAWEGPVLTDLGARADFYGGIGFDTALTDMPASAFQESTAIAGLRRQPPPLVDVYGDPVARESSPEEEEAFTRTNMAHNWLFRMETNLRRFIDVRMTNVFGPEWPRHQLPNGMFDKWVSKQKYAEKAGRDTQPLISYADFTDYVHVICKRDNWQQVFQMSFGRVEDVRESFQRLHPIRLDTMHARAIGQDDELLLYVEVKRIYRITVSR